MLNKPVGYVSNLPSRDEVEACDLITRVNAHGSRHERSEAGESWDAAMRDAHRLNVCGRLDKDSRGLLILTEDGVLAKAIIGGNAVPKTYEVEVDRRVTDRHLDALNGPVSLDGEPLLPMEVTRLSPQVLKFVLREGKNRQIRRLCGALDLGVVDLVRVSVGGCHLKDLPEGCWRLMSEEERSMLRSFAGGREVRDRGSEGGRGGSMGSARAKGWQRKSYGGGRIRG